MAQLPIKQRNTRPCAASVVSGTAHLQLARGDLRLGLGKIGGEVTLVSLQLEQLVLQALQLALAGLPGASKSTQLQHSGVRLAAALQQHVCMAGQRGASQGSQACRMLC